MKVERYGNVKQQTKRVQIQQLIKTNVNEMDIINNSMNPLKQLSNKNTFNVIFDLDVDSDSDRSNNVLYNKVFNKSNLYFIHFDGDNNVYGGYVNTKIDEFDNNWIYDENSYVFSLIKNGKVNNKRYFMKQGENKAFVLLNNDLDGALYAFSSDIAVCKMGSKSWCNDYDCYYEYNNDNKPFIDVTRPDTFVIQRIVVIEMN